MSFNATMKKALVAAAGLLAVVFFAVGPAAADWMPCSDEFNDNVIDTTKWLSDVQDSNQSQNIERTVEGVGYLTLDRFSGSNYTRAVVFGKNAAPLPAGESLQVIFDLSFTGDGYSNYGYVQITPAKQTDPSAWYGSDKVDSVTFTSNHWHSTYTDGLYYLRQFDGGTAYDSVNIFESPVGVHRITLDRDAIDPNDIGVTFEKWDESTSAFVLKHEFALRTNLVSDEYYVNLCRNSYRVATIDFDYVRVDAVPEPSTMTLLVMAGLVGLVSCVRRRG